MTKISEIGQNIHHCQKLFSIYMKSKTKKAKGKQRRQMARGKSRDDVLSLIASGALERCELFVRGIEPLNVKFGS
jgi:hypothetical protein